MHHADSSGEPARRMSHPSAFSGRRGSGATGPSEDHQTPAGSSSPGPHHPPHSLSIQSAGTQVKKKSGFQITSVLPAQVSASANNSIADDTESYDDLDESHTEDLSSSDILDVSVSRATDTGVPERSSSEETLNSLHGGETPGVTSPNEPVMHTGYLVNGVHHHHHHHHKTVQGRPAALPSTVPAVLQAPAQTGRSVQTAPVESAAPSDSSTVPVNPPSTQTAATTASRFRVVKLDSNSEPFRKGRWTCTEYYEKDAPPGDPTSAAHRAVESIIQSEHETTSGSSSGSTLSGSGDVPQAYSVGTHTGTLQASPQTVLLDSSAAPPRPYSEAQSSYPANTQSALPPGEYAAMAAGALQIPPAQTAVSPRAAQLPIGMPGLPALSPRPQMGITAEPQPAAAQLSTSSSSSSVVSNLQPLLHMMPRAALPSSYVTAAQLEDAQRLLLQHHPLLALPRLAAGGMAGLVGHTAADAVAALGQDGGAGADAAAFAASAGADEDSSSGASVVAIDNKIEQAMDLVKSHLMYAVREEVEVLKEQIKELMERNSQLEQENALLKNLSSPEQLQQFQTQTQTQSGSPTAGAPPGLPPAPGAGPTA
ncbi:TSC22 domain family protein 1 isoform X1 [Danio aesculapii]|uniref:TSC22 domain family protein 1 isoform X1 n=1 Tax=Danio aesculapii TaxID=1142201 RepID=UPI0024C087FB|nr:TSC22 domain family protein 1 isoform X1 [Danio aesculapii]